MCERDKPQVTKVIAKKLIRSLYGQKVLEIRDLETEFDSTFFVKLSGKLDGSKSCRYIFKVINTGDSQNDEVNAAHCNLALDLKSQGFKVPIPIRDLNGNYFSYQDLPERNLVKLLTFLDGKLLPEVPSTPTLFREAGVLIARLSNAMQTNSYPGLRHKTFPWSFQEVPAVRQNQLSAVSEAEWRSKFESIFLEFEEKVMSKVDNFVQGAIHGDLHGGNLIVRKHSKTNEWHVTGVIDFGDAHFGLVIFDLAIAAAYAMIQCGDLDSFEAARHLVSGYHSVNPISSEELKVLKVSIATRMAQSITLRLQKQGAEITKRQLRGLQKRYALLERFLALDTDCLERMRLET